MGILALTSRKTRWFKDSCW